MKTNWKIMPRGDYKRACDAAIYVTLTPKGRISINRATFRRLDEPKAVHVLYDAPNNRIGIKPTQPNIKEAYPVASPCNRSGMRRISCYRVLTENGIQLPATVRFYDAEIDHDGILVCDLRTARIPPAVMRFKKPDDKPDPSLDGAEMG